MNFLAVLFWNFLVLKMAGLVTWSWWWVFTPMFVDLVVRAAFHYGKYKR